MQHGPRLFQKLKPLSFDATLPLPRLAPRPPSLQHEKQVKAVMEVRDRLDELEVRWAPNPLMHRPGEKNPLGEFSPYLPPLQIPGEVPTSLSLFFFQAFAGLLDL